MSDLRAIWRSTWLLAALGLVVARIRNICSSYAGFRLWLLSARPRRLFRLRWFPALVAFRAAAAPGARRASAPRSSQEVPEAPAPPGGCVVAAKSADWSSDPGQAAALRLDCPRARLSQARACSLRVEENKSSNIAGHAACCCFEVSFLCWNACAKQLSTAPRL